MNNQEFEAKLAELQEKHQRSATIIILGPGAIVFLGGLSNGAPVLALILIVGVAACLSGFVSYMGYANEAKKLRAEYQQ
jgi:hypothetical protein